MLHRYAGMTFEDFAGEPELFDDIPFSIRPPRVIAVTEEFFADLRIAHQDRRADVYLGDEWVAAFIPRHADGCTRLWVREDLRGPYRDSRIADMTVFAVCCRTGEPMRSIKRTHRSQRVYRRVFDVIQGALRP